MVRLFTILGAISGLLAVALGAFGAHGLPDYFKTLYASELKDHPDIVERMLHNWETAARYEMYHALALIAVAWVCSRWPGKLANAAGWCFAGGTLLFSGSLYILCLTGMRWLGMITPFGGVALMVGWLCLALAAWKTTAVERGA
ncbi:MAG: DUF423 domain-containing protein [Planctomycetes bacterium]|nr:DUF423 domain-containing protein [Planctomycetota bacterium]